VVESHQIELDDKFKAKRSLRPQRVEGICDVLVGVQNVVCGPAPCDGGTTTLIKEAAGCLFDLK
jgi:hypothetical protein